jgi:hypothetical protein
MVASLANPSMAPEIPPNVDSTSGDASGGRVASSEPAGTSSASTASGLSALKTAAIDALFPSVHLHLVDAQGEPYKPSLCPHASQHPEESCIIINRGYIRKGLCCIDLDGPKELFVYQFSCKKAKGKAGLEISNSSDSS